MSILIVLVVLVVLDLLAMRFGVDSRELDIEGRLPSEAHAQI